MSNLQEEKPFKKVLDHGFVRLVDSMGSDLSIVRSARVSYNADWRERSGGEASSKDEKLIGYLLDNKHTSPFESVIFTFEIKCPIFIARQWHRHRTWAYNEVSGRYTELPEEFYVPEPRLIGVQSKDNKQCRDIMEKDVQENEHGSESSWSEHASELINDSCTNSFIIYKSLLARGVPRELARSVLPVATYTRFFGTVNLHNLLHFLKLRLHKHAQYEIRIYAEAILKLIEPVVPVTINHVINDLTGVAIA